MLENGGKVKPSWMELPPVVKIFAALNGNARFVGGCVRDTLLGKPVKDIDAATPLLPEEAIELLRNAGIKVVPTGLKHGTVTAVEDKRAIEITTLRRDEETDGRHAEVSFTDDWQEDAGRRDFTINAMYMDIDGTIYDYFSGQQDLAEKRIRFIGNPEERIREDYLRILRFFRFAAQLSTRNLDEKGLIACRGLAEGIKRLSGERIQGEMFKILASPDPVYAVTAMYREKILPQIGMEKPDLELLEKLIRRESDEKTAEYFPVDPVFRLGLLLLHNLDLPELAERWKLSGRVRSQLAFILQPHDFPTGEKSAKKNLRKYKKENFQNLLRVGLLTGKIEEEKFVAFMQVAKSWIVPEMPVNGDELLQLGMRPGREVGELLARLEEWWEEKNYQPGKLEMLAHAKTLIPANKGW